MMVHCSRVQSPVMRGCRSMRRDASRCVHVEYLYDIKLSVSGLYQYEILLQTLCDRPDLARHVRVFGNFFQPNIIFVFSCISPLYHHNPAVPRTPPLRPARIDIVALLYSVVVNTPNITSFTWMNIFPIPLRILTCLSTLPHLESLTIPLPFVAPFPRNAHTIHRNRESYNARTEVVLSIRPLKHLHLRLFASIESDDKKHYVKWIASMGDTLCSLEMQVSFLEHCYLVSIEIEPNRERYGWITRCSPLLFYPALKHS